MLRAALWSLSSLYPQSGLDGSLNLAVKLDLDAPNFAEVELGFDDLKPALGIGEAVVAVARFEPWISCFLPILDSSEEIVHCLVNTGEDILQNLTVDIAILLPYLFDFRQLLVLSVVRNRHTAHLVGVSSLLQSSIVELFAPSERPFQFPYLLKSRVYAELERFIAKIWILLLSRLFRLRLFLFGRH